MGNDKEKLLQMLETEYGRLKEDLAFMKENCNQLSQSVQTQADSHIDELDSQKIRISELFSDKMVQDVPTGGLMLVTVIVIVVVFVI